MNKEQKRKIKDGFLYALNVEPERRYDVIPFFAQGDELVSTKLKKMIQKDMEEATAIVPAASLKRILKQIERIGKYRILREIGEGGGGVVSEAINEGAGREAGDATIRVAIKLLKLRLKNEESKARFVGERQFIANLNHPNIARLLDGGVMDESIPYLVTEYVDGKRIDEYCACAEKGLQINQKLELFLQVCEGVECFHDYLLVHCDLKPANILVTDEGKVKILDFGIARLLSRPANTDTEARLWTPGYASPEQVNGEATTVVSDVYSLGVTLGEMLTDSPKQSPLKGDLGRIVMKAQNQNPEERYKSALQLAEDIRKYLNSEPVIARRQTRRYLAVKWIRRNPLGALVIAVLLAIVSYGGYLSATSFAERDRQLDRETASREVAIDLLGDASLRIYGDPDSAPFRPAILRLWDDHLDCLQALANDQFPIAVIYSRRSELHAALGEIDAKSESRRKAEALRTGRAWETRCKVVELNHGGAGK